MVSKRRMQIAVFSPSLAGERGDTGDFAGKSLTANQRTRRSRQPLSVIEHLLLQLGILSSNCRFMISEELCWLRHVPIKNVLTGTSRLRRRRGRPCSSRHRFRTIVWQMVDAYASVIQHAARRGNRTIAQRGGSRPISARPLAIILER